MSNPYTMQQKLQNGKRMDAYKYVQGISFADLFNDGGELSQLIGLVSKQNQHGKRELELELRKEEVHIYYLGGRIIKITPKKLKHKYKLQIDYKYFKGKTATEKKQHKLYVELTKNCNNIDYWIKNIEQIKQEIKNYQNPKNRDEYGKTRDNNTEERKLQQQIEANNQDFNQENVVLDIEYGSVNSNITTNRGYKISKIDLVAVRRAGNLYDIELIEFKQGTNAMSNNAGIAQHYTDTKKIIATRALDIKKSVKNIFEFKQKFNLLKNAPKDLPLSGKINCVILVYGVDKNNQSYQNEINKIAKDQRNFDLYQAFLNQDLILDNASRSIIN